MDILIVSHFGSTYSKSDNDRFLYLVKELSKENNVENEKELSVGDKIVYHRVGAYSMTFGGAFIRYFPDVYVNDIKGIEQVRKRITVDDYYSIHSNGQP